MKKKITFFAKRLLPFIFILVAAISYSQVTNQTTSLVYATIQGAVDDAAPGDILIVAPGVYVESIIVDEEVTIQGPKAGVDGNDPTRGTGEAIIYPPAVLYGDGTYNGGYMMRITADNVTIDGLTFDGDNPLLEGVYFANTGTFDIDFGIMSYWSPWYDETDLIGDNLVIQNNVIKNFRLSALVLWAGFEGATAFSSILHNKIQNAGVIYAINLGVNYYADIEYNTILDCRMGVIVSWYYDAKPAGSPGGIISHNSMQFRTIESNWGETYTDVQGIWYHFIYAGADPWTISDNTFINASVAGSESSGIVITIDATEEPMVVINNDISGFENGYRLSTNYYGTTITGGTLINNKYGVTVSNFNFNGNYPAGPSDFTLREMNIQNSLVAGVFLDDNETSQSHETVNANVFNCFINGGPNGILLSADPSFAQQVHDNDLSGNSEYAISNLSPNEVDASCNWFGHWSGPAAADNPNGNGSAVTGIVTYEPWLTEGIDNDLDIAGFQPVPGACIPIICGQNNDKILVCHNDKKTHCIDFIDVQDHLDHGDYLGECEPDYKSIIADEMEDDIQVMISPNPSDHYFTLSAVSASDETIRIEIFEASGKQVKRTEIASGSAYYFGEDLQPGLYFVKVQQGSELKMVKLMKQ